MNQEEQEKFKKMQQELHNLMNDVRDIKSQLGEMYTALMGSKLTKDGGMVAKLNDTADRIEALETAQKAEGMKMNIIWAISGAVGISLLGYLVKIIFK